MASNYTPEEIEQINARAADEIKRFGVVSFETQKQLNDLKIGFKGASDVLSKVTGMLGGLGTSTVDLTKSIAAGDVSLTVFNKSISSTSAALGDLLGLIPYVGGALKTLLKGATDYAIAANDQAKLLHQNYQQLSQIGATAADGMQGVFKNLQNMNYGTDELDKFVSIVRENSKALTYYGKTANEGLEQMASVSQGLKNNGMERQFLDMGMSIDNINKGIAGFMKTQTLYGSRQKMSTDQLVAASANYIKEMDLLAKITGKNKEQQMAQEEKAMQQERFAGYRAELEQRLRMGTDAEKAAAELELKKINTVNQVLGDAAPTLVAGLLNAVGGDASSEETAKAMAVVPNAIRLMQDKTATDAQVLDAIKSDLDRNAKTISGLAKVGANNDYAVSIQETLKAQGILEAGSMEERRKAAEKGTIVTDEATKIQTDANIKLREARDNLQNLINRGIVPVTSSLNLMTGPIAETTKAFTKMAKALGVKVETRDSAPERGSSGYAAEGTKVAGSAESRKSAEKYFGKAISDDEYSALVKATHAEAAGGKQANQQEQAMIMASILNRARDDKGGIMGALNAKNQFQSVTGTAANGNAPSEHYLKGPEKERLKSIEGATQLLENISTKQKNFTAADAAAYGAGTNIGYRNKMLAAGGTTIGGTVFQTTPMNAPVASNPVDKRFADMAQANRDRQAATATDKKMANGGVIPAAPGGVDVIAAEAGMNEAFVPLPDGRTIPVQIAGTDEQMSMMSQQLTKLDDIVRIMQTQLGVSEKILKYAQ